MIKTADIGSAAKMAMEQTKAKRQTQLKTKPLTIGEVKRVFEEIAQTQGSGARAKREHLITSLVSQATLLEVKYLVKIFTGEMRTGLLEGLMEQAVARVFGVPLSKVQHAAMVLGDIGEVAAVLTTLGIEGIERAGFNVFRPVKLMLAQTADSVVDVLVEHGGKTAFEYKDDGARVQIHVQHGKVEIFSRRLNDVTDSLTDVAENIRNNIEVKSAIVEGEVIALNSAGYPIAFQHLMRRFKRIREVNTMQKLMPLSIYLFDILFLNGERLINKTYVERRQILSLNIGKIPLANQLITDQQAAAQSFLQEALAAGHEGLIAKKLDSSYTPGRRGKRWLKIKTILEPLDLVISAAEYGYGRRKGWLSDYYLAAKDPETGEFLDVGKTFKGLSDAEMIDLTRRLKENAVIQKGHKVTVIPKIVVEVAYNEIQWSQKCKSQMALRFARITRMRDDKTPQDSSTIGHVREIYERQFHIKGKYSMQENR